MFICLFIHLLVYWYHFLFVCYMWKLLNWNPVHISYILPFFAQFYCLQRSMSLRLSTTWAIRTWYHGCKRPGDASNKMWNQSSLLGFSVALGISASADKHIPFIAFVWARIGQGTLVFALAAATVWFIFPIKRKNKSYRKTTQSESSLVRRMSDFLFEVGQGRQANATLAAQWFRRAAEGNSSHGHTVAVCLWHFDLVKISVQPLKSALWGQFMMGALAVIPKVA